MVADIAARDHIFWEITLRVIESVQTQPRFIQRSAAIVARLGDQLNVFFFRQKEGLAVALGDVLCVQETSMRSADVLPAAHPSTFLAAVFTASKDWTALIAGKVRQCFHDLAVHAFSLSKRGQADGLAVAALAESHGKSTPDKIGELALIEPME